MLKLFALNVGWSKRITVILLSILILFIFLFYHCVHVINKTITSVEFFSLNYKGRVVLDDRKAVTKLAHIIDASLKKEGAEKYKTVRDKTAKEGNQRNYPFKMILYSKNGQRTFMVGEELFLYDQLTGKNINLNDKGKCLTPWIEELKKLNPHGEYLAWNQVKNIFKKYTKAKVIDFETGQFFWVQRRAGSLHADVQPLTAKDSAVMKKIYDGKWSWKRRAVIVEVGGKRLAGSMNGMPHGAGAISGNDFNGHFCIHFRESKLHSKREDPAHQFMTWKAAGVVDDMLAEADPEKIMEVTLKFLEQGDYETVSRMMGLTKGKGLDQRLKSIDWLVVSKYDKAAKENQEKKLKVYFSYKLKHGGTFSNRPVILEMIEGHGEFPWKISAKSLEALFLKEKNA